MNLILSTRNLAAFADISANFSAALSSVKSGITDPNAIFAQGHEEVVTAWKAFEEKRKTMTYLPYKYASDTQGPTQGPPPTVTGKTMTYVPYSFSLSG